MATLNGNDYYMTIDGTDVSDYLVNVELEPSMEAQDVTAGSGADFIERAEGLSDYSLNFTMAWDSAQEATHLPLMQPGLKTIIYGPRGSTAGYPKHHQSFLFQRAPSRVNVSKEMVAFQVSAMGNGTPTTDLYGGGTF